MENHSQTDEMLSEGQTSRLRDQVVEDSHMVIENEDGKEKLKKKWLT